MVGRKAFISIAIGLVFASGINAMCQEKSDEFKFGVATCPVQQRLSTYSFNGRRIGSKLDELVRCVELFFHDRVPKSCFPDMVSCIDESTKLD